MSRTSISYNKPEVPNAVHAGLLLGLEWTSSCVVYNSHIPIYLEDCPLIICGLTIYKTTNWEMFTGSDVNCVLVKSRPKGGPFCDVIWFRTCHGDSTPSIVIGHDLVVRSDILLWLCYEIFRQLHLCLLGFFMRLRHTPSNGSSSGNLS